MKKKIDYKILIIGMLVLVIAAVSVLFILAKSNNNDLVEAYEAALGDKDFEISVLNDELDSLSATVTIYRTKKDIKSGNMCVAEDLEQVAVPEAMADGYNTKLEDIVGKYYLTDMGKGEAVYKHSVFYTQLKKDDRYLDIICDREPIGFKKGDTVDIRVSCPDGQDYLLLEGKLVHNVYGNVVNILADEKDIIIYKGMEADWCRFYKGAEVGKAMMIYCVSHVQGALQTAQRYYPIANVLPDGVTFEGSTLWTALHDLNLSEADLSDWEAADRKTFEKSLELYDQYRRVDYTYVTRLALGDEFRNSLQRSSLGSLSYAGSEGGIDPLTSFKESVEYFKRALSIGRETKTVIGTDGEETVTYGLDAGERMAAEVGMLVGENEVAYVIQCSEDDDFIESIESTYQGTKVLGSAVYDKTVSIDMIRGAKKVPEANAYRDEIYLAAANAFAEQTEKLRQAKAAAELEGIPFDEDTWEYTFALYQQKMGQDQEAEIVEEDGIVR